MSTAINRGATITNPTHSMRKTAATVTSASIATRRGSLFGGNSILSRENRNCSTPSPTNIIAAMLGNKRGSLTEFGALLTLAGMRTRNNASPNKKATAPKMRSIVIRTSSRGTVSRFWICKTSSMTIRRACEVPTGRHHRRGACRRPILRRYREITSQIYFLLASACA